MKNTEAKIEELRRNSGSALNCIVMFLCILFTPRCWVRNRITNRVWDRMLLKQLENPLFTDRDEYTVVLNGVKVWVANYPYDYGYDYSGKNSGLPSRSTVFKLRKALIKIET